MNASQASLTVWSRTAIICALFLFLETLSQSSGLSPLGRAIPEAQAQSVQEASNLPQYQAAQLSPGTLTSVGSDSMGGLMDRWIEAYRKRQAGVQVRLTSRGSASAPPALLEGSADLGPMAREMKTRERNAFLATYGFEPTQVEVAFAAVGIYVAEASPRRSITVDELRALFGEANELATTPIFGQVSHPYLAGYFRQKVLRQQPFSAFIGETASPGALFEVLSQNEAAIGFAALQSSVPEGVRLLPVAEDVGEPAIAPTFEHVRDASYPLSRSLNIYIAREPNEGVDPALKDFLFFILSNEGQGIVAQQGLLPLSATHLEKQRALLQ